MDTFWQVSWFITIYKIGAKFPLLSPLKWFFAPISVLVSHLRIERLNREAVEYRVAHRDEPHPMDLFDSMLPPGSPAPVGRQKVHFEILAGHLLVGGFESVSNQYQNGLMFLLQEPEMLRALLEEVRTKFNKPEDITAESLVSLPFLNAVLHESLRLTANVAAMIPRESPGALVDGFYVPKGVRTDRSGYFRVLYHTLIYHSLRLLSTMPILHSPVVHDTFTRDDLSDLNVGCPRTTPCTTPHMPTTRSRHFIPSIVVLDPYVLFLILG